MADSEDIEESVQINLDAKGDPVIGGTQSDVKGVHTKVEHSVTSLPVRNVTVFVDRAEVNRLLETEDLPVGDAEILIKDLPSVIDEDSVRVRCFGQATILEVAYQTKVVTEKVTNKELEEKNESEAEKIRKSIKELENEKEAINQSITIMRKEQELLQNYAQCISSNKTDKVGEVMEKKSIENFMNFLSIFKDRNENLTKNTNKSVKDIESINEKMEALRKNLSQMKPASEEKHKQERNISILIDVHKAGDINFIVSYVVKNASWTPLYDIRAFNKDSTVQILYFATVKQNTGEDWNDAKLSLSTAMPSIGGSPPKLEPQYLNLEQKVKIKYQSSAGFARRKKEKSVRGFGMALAARASFRNEYDPTIEDSYECDDMLYDDFQESALNTAEASEGIISTNFEIARPASVLSDNVGHKVSIAHIDLKPEFEYYATPKLVAHAFLKIKTKNESPYAMLSGVANVFLDNNFLTKSSLPSVSPMEEFEVSLGADPAVKVEYKPLKKFQLTSGVISKSQVYRFHQVIEVKNTKTQPIKVIITDQCPKSNNDKIKAILEEPDIKIPKASSNEPPVVKSGNVTFYTATNLIDWEVNVPKSETKILNLKYQVEHPMGTKITGLHDIQH